MIPVMLITVVVWFGMVITDEPIDREVAHEQDNSDTQ